MMNLTVDAATKRLQVAGPSLAMTYDANGNMTRTPEAGAITYDGRNRAQTIEVESGWRRVYDTTNRPVWRVGPPNVHTGHDGPDLSLD